MTVLRIPLLGAGGEPVDFWRTVASHGLVFLPPTRVDAPSKTLEATVRLRAGARTVRLRQHGGFVEVDVLGEPPEVHERVELEDAVRHVLRLDEDLSEFYELSRSDPDLHWAGIGAARLVRSQTVFEEVVKTICTTNCTWSATERMVEALVAGLGEAAPTAPDGGSGGRAFPTPEALAAADESFFRESMRSGYRGPYLRRIAAEVASGELDLEGLATARPEEVSDEDLERELLALPGVGPYAAAHIMLLIGRYSRLVLDSWTRPKYAALVGKKKTDRQIAWRFRRYGRYAGLAFWLFVTQDWVEGATEIR
jgi:3-methyladenine DNA glycosylase/8-oxoguanine DNA glycosylase